MARHVYQISLNDENENDKIIIEDMEENAHSKPAYIKQNMFKTAKENKVKKLEQEQQPQQEQQKPNKPKFNF